LKITIKILKTEPWKFWNFLSFSHWKFHLISLPRDDLLPLSCLNMQLYFMTFLGPMSTIQSGVL